MEAWWSRTPHLHPISVSWLRCSAGHRWREPIRVMLEIVRAHEPEIMLNQLVLRPEMVTESQRGSIIVGPPYPDPDRDRSGSGATAPERHPLPGGVILA